jgi:hypothetical protein
MTGTFGKTIAIAGLGSALTLAAAAVGGPAVGSPHQAMSTQHASAKHHHAKELLVKGLVASHHGRTVTVFAKTAKAGATTRHNKRIKVVFARSAHGKTKIHAGNHIRIVATGTATGHVFTVRHCDDETVNPSPASLFFGTVQTVSANLLTVSERDRDNGDHHDGDEHHHGHHGGGDGDSPADHGHGGDDGDGHQITIDDSTATITVDGASGTIVAGDTVAVLGEATHNTVVASTIYAFTQAPGFMRGNVQQVSGDNVTLRDRGTTITVSLADVPLAINGDVGATPSQLKVGDKLLVIGDIDIESGQVTPEVAFAFNHHDDHPCGDNHGHGHGDDGDGHGGGNDG